MSENFDPYYSWLGIPTAEQPPNHYRLLGIQRFEALESVIENAADQRMAFLKNHQTGVRAEFSQQLLNEVAAARICLLNRETKAAYDRQFELDQASDARSTSPPVVPTEKRTPPFVSLASSRSKQRRRTKQRGLKWMPIATVFLASILAATVVWIFGRSSTQQTDNSPLLNQTELRNQFLERKVAELEQENNRLHVELDRQQVDTTREVNDFGQASDAEREKIINALTGRNWYWHWEEDRKDHRMIYAPDGTTKRGEAKGKWKLEQKWVLMHGGHYLIQVDDRTFRGFHIRSGREVGINAD